MFKKMKFKKAIKTCKNEIDFLESKRSRSQSALVQAILQHKDPDETDVEFFNKYTAQIDETRERMHALQRELDELDA